MVLSASRSNYIYSTWHKVPADVSVAPCISQHTKFKMMYCPKYWWKNLRVLDTVIQVTEEFKFLTIWIYMVSCFQYTTV